MTRRTVRFERGHQRELDRWPAPVRTRLRAALHELAKDPTGRSTGLEVKPLQVPPDTPRTFRCAIGGHRIAFIVSARHVTVIRIFHRSEGYDWVEGG